MVNTLSAVKDLKIVLPRWSRFSELLLLPRKLCLTPWAHTCISVDSVHAVCVCAGNAYGRSTTVVERCG